MRWGFPPPSTCREWDESFYAESSVKIAYICQTKHNGGCPFTMAATIVVLPIRYIHIHGSVQIIYMRGYFSPAR